MPHQTTPPNFYFVKEDDAKYAPPCFQNTGETREEVECQLQGDWPNWLQGTFMRVGLGKTVVPTSEDGSKPNAVLQHFFDALGYIHRFRFSDGKVRYMCRSNTEGVERKAKKNGFIQTHMFGPNANTPLIEAQDPCSALLRKQQSLYLPDGDLEPDELNIQVVPRRGFHIPPGTNPKDRGTQAADPEKEELVVLTDYNFLQVVDAESLEPKRLITYGHIDPELKGFGICAHPPKDRKRQWIFNYIVDERGVLHTFALDYGAKPAALVWKTPLPCKPCYIHSLACSQDYVIFIRNPVSMDLSDPTKPVSEIMKVEHDSNTLFYVMEKETGKFVAQYAAPHFMFFHIVNAYNYADPRTGQTSIHVDFCAYDGYHLPYAEYALSNIVDPSGPYQNGQLVRHELAAVPATPDPHTERRATSAGGIVGVGFELPRINKAYSCDPSYRYVYAVCDQGAPAPGTRVPIGRLGNGLQYPSGAFFGGVAKGDWATGGHAVWRPRGGESCPCEPVFIARPGASEEDDGVVLTIVLSRDGDHSVLVALDGRTMEEVARAKLPQVYGLGPHGTFIEGA
ncbi:carotenoid oxygenase [Xylariaceae sp. FL0016]|nr:carotenoid oxygenase [Xylariaceae sp. FL0016]